jgi:hypothetical protein
MTNILTFKLKLLSQKCVVTPKIIFAKLIFKNVLLRLREIVVAVDMETLTKVSARMFRGLFSGLSISRYYFNSDS